MARKQYDDDDGRVIVPMNVEGMPWYQERPPEVPGREQTEMLNKKQTCLQEAEKYSIDTVIQTLIKNLE